MIYGNSNFVGPRPLIYAPKRSFNPLSLSPALWLDFSDQSTLFDATSGGSNVVDGGAIARVEDKSGNGHSTIQSVLNDRLIYRAAAQNGRGYGEADGVTDFMTSTVTGFKSYTALTIVDVTIPVAAAAADTNSAFWWGWGNVSTASGPYPANRTLHLTSSTGGLSGETITLGLERAGTGRLGSNSYSRAANTCNILTTEISTTSTKLFTNSSEVSLNLNGGGASVSGNNTPLAIGYTVDDNLSINTIMVSGSLVIGPATKFCERLIFNKVLTSGEKTQLWNYLSTKWGITLS